MTETRRTIVPADILPGLGVCILLSVAAKFVSELSFAPFTTATGKHPIEPVMLALILGLLIANSIAIPASLKKGVTFAVKRVLAIGIIFLGARLNLSDIVKLG